MSLSPADAADLESRLNDLARFAEEISALAHTHNRQTASKFARIAKYARHISTCVRMHGLIPQERELPEAVQLVSKLHKLATLAKDTTDTFKRHVR